MSRPGSLPPVFTQYAGQVIDVQQVSDHEWSSSCPACGTEGHNDRTPSDRCRWFINGKPVGWCRRCNTLFWPDADKAWLPPSLAELAAWRQKQIETAEARKRSVERELANLRQSEVWERYYEQLDDTARTFWRTRGIGDAWQSFWRLGWDTEHSFYNNGTEYRLTTATIPLFSHDWQPLNIKHRIINPPADFDKYRYEIAGQPQPLFLTDPDKELTGHVYCIEGEIKAAVTFAWLEDGRATIVGLPGKNIGANVQADLAKAERLTVVLDPDVTLEACHKLVGQMGGQRTRVLVTPVKIDDGILRERPGKKDIECLLRQARRIE